MENNNIPDNNQNLLDEKKSYYSILPATVRYDKDLTANSKLLYSEITALTNEKGYCWASNNYFADLYNVTPQAISKWIKILEQKNYLSIKYIHRGKEIIQRRVSINIDTYQQMIKGGINKKLKRILNINIKERENLFLLRS